MKFSKESKIENGQEIIEYFIDNKKVDEKTYWSLQEEEFHKNIDTEKISFVQNPNKKNTQDSLEFKEDAIFIKYASDFLENLIALPKNDAINLIIDEFNFQCSQAYIQSQIDYNRQLVKSFKSSMRECENVLEDLFDAYEFDEEDIDE